MNTIPSYVWLPYKILTLEEMKWAIQWWYQATGREFIEAMNLCHKYKYDKTIYQRVEV